MNATKFWVVANETTVLDKRYHRRAEAEQAAEDRLGTNPRGTYYILEAVAHVTGKLQVNHGETL